METEDRGGAQRLLEALGKGWGLTPWNDPREQAARDGSYCSRVSSTGSRDKSRVGYPTTGTGQFMGVVLARTPRRLFGCKRINHKT